MNLQHLSAAEGVSLVAVAFAIIANFLAFRAMIMAREARRLAREAMVNAQKAGVYAQHLAQHLAHELTKTNEGLNIIWKWREGIEGEAVGKIADETLRQVQKPN
jgi:heme exporter protein D